MKIRPANPQYAQQRLKAAVARSYLAKANEVLPSDHPAALALVERACAVLGAPPEEGPSSSARFGLWQVLLLESYIADHLTREIDPASLAGLVRVRLPVFLSAFHNTFGEPVSLHIQRRRAEAARNALATGQLSMSRRAALLLAAGAEAFESRMAIADLSPG